MRKYLKVTIHDNDFTHTLDQVCELLYDSFQFEGKFPTEEDFPQLKTAIQHLWYGADIVKNLMRWGYPGQDCFKYLYPNLEIVEEKDIPEWDNDEIIYIPLFENGQIKRR